MRTRAIVVLVLMTSGGCLGSVMGGAANSGGDGGSGSGNAVYFDPDVQSAIDTLGCSSGDCHGDPGTPMHVVALAKGGSVDANYHEVVARTTGGAMALLLSKPVSGNATMHAGGKLFAADSATYRQWSAWIAAGAPLRAPGAMPAASPGDMAPPPPPSGDMGPCVAPKVTTTSSHNAGQECIACHANDPDPTLRFTLAGTLYMDRFGATPRGGATIQLVDSKSATLALVSDVDGNFYTTKALAFPVTVSASACPSTVVMMSPSANGACNASGCHDATRPAYLP